MPELSSNKGDDQEMADIEDDGKHKAGINDVTGIKIASSAPMAYIGIRHKPSRSRQLYLPFTKEDNVRLHIKEEKSCLKYPSKLAGKNFA